MTFHSFEMRSCKIVRNLNRFCVLLSTALLLSSNVAHGAKKAATKAVEEPELEAIAPTSKFSLDIRPVFGFTRVWDTISSPTGKTTLETGAGMFTWGVGLQVAPWRDAEIGLDYRRGGTEIQAPSGSSPLRPELGWSRLQLDLGWAIQPNGFGPIRSIVVGGGYGRETLATGRQSPVQWTPTWTHNELHLDAIAHAPLMQEKLESSLRVGLVPFISASESFGTSGNDPWGFGFDLEAAAAYHLASLPGAGDLLAGGVAGWGYRRVQFSGTGQRRTADSVSQLRKVSNSFQRLSLLFTVTWRFPGSTGGSLFSGGDDEARIEGSAIRISRRIRFKTGSAEIDMARSQRALDAVARLLKNRDEIQRIEVVGHTDDRGTEEENLALSRDRAAEVVTALRKSGVSAGRLLSRGLGSSKPVASNKTEEGRAKNRRVEFNILETGEKSKPEPKAEPKPKAKSKPKKSKKPKKSTFSDYD